MTTDLATTSNKLPAVDQVARKLDTLPEQNGLQIDWENLEVICLNGISPKQAMVSLKSDIEKLMTPAPIDALLKHISALSVMVPTRQATSDDLEFRDTLIARKLSKFPADAAIAALDPKRYQWFPTLKEILRVANSASSKRHGWLWLLKRKIPHAPDTPPKPAQMADQDQIKALLARMGSR